MAIFHYTVKIIGRSRGRSVIAASAYLNGNVMKDEETGRSSYYTSKKEVVYTSLMMCNNAPPEWEEVPEKEIIHFRDSIRYKGAEDKSAALEKFRLTYRKQRLWNEVLKAEKGSNAQLGRSFEFSLPREWSREEQIYYAGEYIRKNFVEKGMCADWAIHDKGDGNPHVHMLVTMRPFREDHSWGNKEVKDWAFVRDSKGSIVVDESHPCWWQDKKDPERHGIRIPVLDENGDQKTGARNRKLWKRELVDATGWNNPRNCEAWREDWAKECNLRLPPEKQIDHRSFARQGKIGIPGIHEGADARKIEEKSAAGLLEKGSWRVEENRAAREQNNILRAVQEMLRLMSEKLTRWKERISDFRRKQGTAAHDDGNDRADRRTAENDGRNGTGAQLERSGDRTVQGADQEIAAIKQRIAGAAQKLAGYRRNALAGGTAGPEYITSAGTGLSVEGIIAAAERRKQIAAETEQRIAEIERRIKKEKEIDERIRVLTGRYTYRPNPAEHRPDESGNIGKRHPDRKAEETDRGITDLKRETEQREQVRKRTSIKERLDEKKRLVEERTGKNKSRRSRERGMSL